MVALCSSNLLEWHKRNPSSSLYAIVVFLVCLLFRAVQPLAKASRIRMASVPSSCRWSLWATLTLWSGTDSFSPCLKLLKFSAWSLASLSPHMSLSKASRSRMSSVRSVCCNVLLGDAGTCSRAFLDLSTLNTPTHPEYSIRLQWLSTASLKSLPQQNGVGALQLSYGRPGRH